MGNELGRYMVEIKRVIRGWRDAQEEVFPPQ